MTGLNEYSFPASYMRFSLHDDDIARELHERHQAEEPLLFYLAVYGARQLFLTFPGIDDEGNDYSMSPYLREIQEAVGSWSSPHFHSRVAGAAWENGASNIRGQCEQIVRKLKKDFTWLSSMRSSAATVDLSIPKRIKRAVEASINLAENRGVNLSTHPSFEVAREQWNPNHVVSVTDLELYLSCPFKFFLSRLLNLSVTIRVEGELDPATRGQIIHVIPGFAAIF